MGFLDLKSMELFRIINEKQQLTWNKRSKTKVDVPNRSQSLKKNNNQLKQKKQDKRGCPKQITSSWKP